MAVFAFTNARVEINSVNLSDHVRQVSLTVGAAELPITAMGDSWDEVLAGLKNWSVEVEFNQDFAASNVDATLFSLVGAASFTIKVRPTADAIAPTNPEFNGSVILPNYAPLGGSVGDVATAKATFKGTGALTRSTA